MFFVDSEVRKLMGVRPDGQPKAPSEIFTQTDKIEREKIVTENNDYYSREFQSDTGLDEIAVPRR